MMMHKNNDKIKELKDKGSQIKTIRPPGNSISIDLKEFWAYRELVYFLVWRDVKVRYKQTIIGFIWAIIQPVFMMVVFSLFFGTLAKIPSGNIPYPLFNYAALLPWTLFANSVTRASNSLIQDTNLLQKVYFPRLLMPLSGTLSPLMDFLVAFVVLIGLMLYYSYLPSLMMLWVLPLLILELMLATGIGLWLSAINVQFRDVVYVVPFLIQLLLFASPVIYSSTFVPPRFQTAYGLINPMSGIIEGFRWAILGTTPPSRLLIASVGIIIIILISGVIYFRRREKIFADVV
jgi:lipopolysaccharide transport system permease protein